MDSYFSQKDEIWFLRVCHDISNAVYRGSVGVGKAASRSVLSRVELQMNDFIHLLPLNDVHSSKAS